MSDLRELLDRAVVCIAMSPRQHTADEQRIADKLLAEARAALLLPPAPDGATEGWRLVPEGRALLDLARGYGDRCRERHAAGAKHGYGSREHIEVVDRLGDSQISAKLRDAAIAYSDAMLAASPSVSPVRPKGEEKPQFWLILHDRGCVPNLKGPWPDSMVREVLREFMRELPETLIDCLRLLDGRPVVDHGPELLTMLDGRSAPLARRYNAATADLPAPSQTGEENAGLVDEARTAALVYRTTEVHGYAKAADLIDRLADKLASRSPIPGGALQNQLTRNPGELAATNPIPGEARK